MISQLVVPCGGKGSRFLPITETPKFLIPIAGRPMFDWSIASTVQGTKYETAILILHNSFYDGSPVRNNMVERLKQTMETVAQRVIVARQSTPLQGAAHTILEARGYIDPTKSVAVWNCDQWCPSWPREEIAADLHSDGWIPTFHAPDKHPRWSYVEVNDDLVKRVVEKAPISEEATVGGYIFRRARDLLWAIEEMIHFDARTNNEFYLAPCFNFLIKNDRKIRAVRVPEFEGLGTPEDLDAFCANHKLPSWREVNKWVL